MKIIKLFAAMVAVLSLTASCCKQGDFTVSQIEDVVFSDMSGVDIIAIVDNQTCRNMTLKSAKLVLSDGDNPIIEAVLRSEVKIHKKEEQTVVLPVAIKIQNPFAILSLPRKLQRGANDLLISGVAVVKAGAFLRHKEVIPPTPLKQFLNDNGITEDDVKNLISL